MRVYSNTGNFIDFSAASVLLDNGKWAQTFSADANGQITCQSAVATVAPEALLLSMATEPQYPPFSVMFGEQIYMFYVSSGNEILYCVYDQASGWSRNGSIPCATGVATTVSAAVFTPFASNTPQIYVFYGILGDDGYSNHALVTSTDGITWSLEDFGEGVSAIGAPSAVVYTPSTSSGPILCVFYTGPGGGPVGETQGTYTSYWYLTTSVGYWSTYDSPIATDSGSCALTPYSLTSPVVSELPGTTSPLLYVFYPATSDNVQRIAYSTWDGTTWTNCGPISSSQYDYSVTVSAATFPSQSFLNQMSSSQDIYLSYEVEGSASAPNTSPPRMMEVASLSQFAAGTAATQGGSTNLPVTFSATSGTLLPVYIPGIQAPQAWAFGLAELTASSGDSTNQIYYDVYGRNGWERHLVSTIEPTCSPSAVRFKGRAFLFSNSNANELCYTDYNIQSAQALTLIDGAIASQSPSAVVFNDVLYIFYQGAGANASQLWYTSSTNGSTWSASQQVEGVTLSESPSATIFDGTLYVFYQGANNNGQLWYSTLTTTGWQSPVQVIPAGQSVSTELVAGSPAACVTPATSAQAEQLMVFYAIPGTLNNWQLAGCGLSNSIWTQSEIPGVAASASPSTGIIDGKLCIFYTATDSNTGQLWYSEFDGQSWTSAARLGTTSTMAGWATCVALKPPSSELSNYFVFHNNTNSSIGQITYIQLTYSLQTTSPVGPTNAVTGQPSATIFNDSVWVFYQGAGENAGQLCYVSAPTDSLNTSGQVTFGEGTVVTLAGTTPGAADMLNDPAAIVFPPAGSGTTTNPSQLYVFYEGAGDDGNILYCTTVDGITWTPGQVTFEANGQSLAARLPDFASPAAAVKDNMLYVSRTGLQQLI